MLLLHDMIHTCHALIVQELLQQLLVELGVVKRLWIPDVLVIKIQILVYCEDGGRSLFIC